MPRFVIAPDSFKESLTAMQACHAMQRGICSVMPQAECIVYLWQMVVKVRWMH